MFPVPRVGKALANYYTVRFVEGTDAGNEAIKKYGVQAFPTLLVIDTEGTVVDEVRGGFTAGRFVGELARILEGKDTLKSLRAALATDAEDLVAGLTLAEKLVMRRPEEARALAVRLRPVAALRGMADAASFMAVEADALSMLGDDDQARAVIAEAMRLKLSGEAMDDVIMTGIQLALNGPALTGLAFFEQAKGRGSESSEDMLTSMKPHLYVRAGDEALLARGNAATHAEALNNAAWTCYMRSIHTEAAIGWARQAVLLSKGEPHILDTLGHLLFRADQLEEAIKVQRQAVAKVEDPDMKLGLEEALVQFEAVKRLRDSRE